MASLTVRYEANRRLGTFNVSARCADGYRGVAVVEELVEGVAAGHWQKLVVYWGMLLSLGDRVLLGVKPLVMLKYG